jgi:regulator of nucleoside diphosphate kinase
VKYGSLVFEKDNFVMIRYYHETNEICEDYAHKNTLDVLMENMSNALILNNEDMPEDIVQIYSTIAVTATSGWCETFGLVPPFEENVRKGKISVISTLGASLIGLSEGDSLKYGLPGDLISLRIEEVRQSRKRVRWHISEEKYKELLSNKYKNSLTLNI